MGHLVSRGWADHGLAAWGITKPWLGNLAIGVGVAGSAQPSRLSPEGNMNSWGDSNCEVEPRSLCLRAQPIQKGSYHNLSKDAVVQLGKGASACHCHTLEAEAGELP